jgi:hypothetical protein
MAAAAALATPFATRHATRLSAQVPATSGHFVVIGNVRGADDTRLAGAIVELRRGDARTRVVRTTNTDVNGGFRFIDVDSGSIELRVRRVGFRPETLQVDVPQVDGGAVVVPLERIAQVLRGVVVHARSGALNVVTTPLLGFERRRAAGLGHFITRTDIDRRRPQRTSDLMRSIAGVVLEQGDGGVLVPRFRSSLVARQACNPMYWLDGSPLGSMPLDLDAISPSAIEGIEVYSGIATVPPALRGPGGSAVCGVIAVWTRHGGPRGGAGSVSSAELARLVEQGEVFTADQVDEAASVLPVVPFAPEYPDSLRNVSGRVVAEFVVDEEGEVEGETIGFVSSTRAGFVDPVRMALFGLRFAPAVRKGRPVRQVVQWPVTFDSDDRTMPNVKVP